MWNVLGFLDNLHIYESDIEYLGGRFEYSDTSKRYFSGAITLCNISCQVDFMRLQDGVVVARRYVDEEKASLFKRVVFDMLSEDEDFSVFLFTRHTRQLLCMIFEILSVFAMLLGLLSGGLLGICSFIFFFVAFIVFYKRFRIIRNVRFKKG